MLPNPAKIVHFGDQLGLAVITYGDGHHIRIHINSYIRDYWSVNLFLLCMGSVQLVP